MPLNWGVPTLPAGIGLVFSLAVAWEAVWKGIALWKAGRNGHRGWFIALFIINSLGILPIIYILAFSQKSEITSPPQK